MSSSSDHSSDSDSLSSSDHDHDIDIDMKQESSSSITRLRSSGNGNNDDITAGTSRKQYYYEQLGAPTVLYRHKPSYNAYTTSSARAYNQTSKLPAADATAKLELSLLSSSSSSQSRSQARSQSKSHISSPSSSSSLISGSNIDVDSIYPPQPWNRRAPGHLEKRAPRQIVQDAHHCVDVIRKADRARIRRYFKSTLKFQSDTQCNNNNGNNNNDSKNNDSKNNDSKNNDNTNKKNVNDKEENNEFVIDGIPIEKDHQQSQQDKYDSSNYILLNHKVRNAKTHFNIAAAYKAERMHSSPLDGYCAPFSKQSVRYALGDERELPLTVKEENERKLNKEGVVSINDLNKGENKCKDKNEGEGEGHTNSKNDDNDHDDKVGTGASTGSEKSIVDNNEIRLRKRDREHLSNDDKKDGTTKDDNSISSHNSSSSNSSSSMDSDNDNDNDNDMMTTNKETPYTLKNTSKKKWKRKRKAIHGQKEKISENLQFHGNCISLIPCVCKVCCDSMKRSHNKSVNSSDGADAGTCTDDSKNDNHMNSSSPNYFLLHPTGESVTISSLILPHGKEKVPQVTFEKGCHRNRDIGVDVGGRVLQIDACFDIEQHADKTFTSNYANNFSWYFIVRTALHCSVIICIPTQRGRPKERTPDKRKKAKVQYTTTKCSGMYEIKELHRVHLNSPDDKRTYYELLYMTTRCQSPSSLGAHLNFAIVSNPASQSNQLYQHNKRETNIIHNIQVNYYTSSKVQRHCISSLESISHIEYSPSHPMVLWAAARSSTKPTLYIGKGSYRRPMIGYGHSLYSIDLRCDQANFTWSPSSEEFMMDGIHSISGILTDHARPHTLNIKSLSAGGRMYEIDTRMPSRTVLSWGLPGLCDDSSAHLSSSGPYGLGVLMTRPINAYNTQVPLISVNKNPSAYGIQLYQRPLSLPRFQTQALEMPMTSGSGSKIFGSAGFATSTSFPISESSAITGISAFFTPLSSVCSNFDSIHYEKRPEKALCVISATSVGDLCAQTLVVVPATEGRKSVIVDGGGIGSCAMNLPCDEYGVSTEIRDKHFAEGGELHWALSSSFTVQSKSILKQHVAFRSQCRNFKTVKFMNLPRHQNKSGLRTMDNDTSTLCHPGTETYMGHSKEAPPILTIKAQYLRDTVESMEANKILSDKYREINANSLDRNPKIDISKNNIEKLKDLWGGIDNERTAFEDM